MVIEVFVVGVVWVGIDGDVVFECCFDGGLY